MKWLAEWLFWRRWRQLLPECHRRKCRIDYQYVQGGPYGPGLYLLHNDDTTIIPEDELRDETIDIAHYMYELVAREHETGVGVK